ncbi:hypothetical protein GCM10009133_06280 [Cocleimonas flava]|uniref:Ankyrin repeat protein n=1 Tax=Cocleimonas flava TaxID=634765 RepID=A0A4R1EYM0_9GAMM|nr:ankyrin repeat domain-containing protein [Cocleimonas flava]TCJ86996.1 ankyrin repeat protein [Cocleimonas flava]
MKFPSLASTLKLLKPLTSPKVHTETVGHHNDDTEITLYDYIEEIISIYDTHNNRNEILTKFYQLSEIHQQILIVTLIENNIFDTLKVIVESSYDVNFLIRGQSPLHFAIIVNNMNMVKLLLNHDADIELEDHFKETALNCAVRTANNNMIKYLLEQGADANTHSSDNTSPLTFAINQGNNEAVNILLEYGALLDRTHLVRTL